MSNFLDFLACDRTLPSQEMSSPEDFLSGRLARLSLEAAGQLSIPFTATVIAQGPRRPRASEAWREGWADEIAAAEACDAAEDPDPFRRAVRSIPDRHSPGMGPGGAR